MFVIHAKNVNQAYAHGVRLLLKEGVREESRAGPVLVYPSPVATVYSHPRERVLFNAERDANPFFHLMEALWMLGGRNDITWLDQFVHDFSARFGEADGTMHGAYGFRWRKHFDLDGGGPQPLDQLKVIIELLRKDPTSRQAVLQMWDPVADLPREGLPAFRDRPCNTVAYFRIRNAVVEGTSLIRPVLDMTVCCRSNDIILGAYGANAVHFSVLQEYMAAHIDVHVGVYTQVSNNYHAYTGMIEKYQKEAPVVDDLYFSEDSIAVPIIHPSRTADFDLDLSLFLSEVWRNQAYRTTFFSRVALPLRVAYVHWRQKEYNMAEYVLTTMPECDWRLAAFAWLKRRLEKYKNAS